MILALVLYILGMIIGAICIGAFVLEENRIPFVWAVIMWPVMPFILFCFGAMLLICDYIPKKLVYFGEYLREKFKN